MRPEPRGRWPLRLYGALLAVILAVNGAGFTLTEVLRRMGPVPLGESLAYSTLVVDARAPQTYGFQVVSTTVFDDVGFAQQGNLAAGGATDDRNPSVNVTLNAALDSVHRVAIFNGSTFLGYASGVGTSYSFTPVAPLSFGAHSLQARIVNPVTGTEVHTGVSQSLVVQGISFTEVVDDVGLLTGNALDRSWSHGRDPLTGNQGLMSANAGGTTVLDDSLPLVKGTLGIALAQGQSLDVYLGTNRLGAATVVGTDWQYQLQTGQELPAGVQGLSARIVDGSGQTVLQSDSTVLSVNTQQGDLAARVTLTNADIAQFNVLEAGQTLDLTQISGPSQPRIDQINLTGLGFPGGGGNKVILSVDDVLQAGVGKFVEGSGFAGLVADGRKQLMVTGIPGGTVEVLDNNANVNDNWTAAGSVTDGASGQTYLVYNSGSNAQLLIDSDLIRQGALPIA